MKIVFFGTSEVGLPIIELLNNNHEIAAVITSPDAPVGRKQILTPSPIATFADEHELKTLKPEKVKDNQEFISELKQFAADIFIVVSYGKILPLELLEIPPLKTINVHYSLLPKYRGPSPIQTALLNGDTNTGTTIFVLDEQVDHGPIIATEELEILPDDTFSSLAPKLSEISAALLEKILPDYQSGKLMPANQNHDAATFTSLIRKEHGRIDWSKPAQEIYNQYRAFNQWPGIWTTWQERIFKILECSLDNDRPEALLIPCGENTQLAVTILQPEGKNAMTSRDFLNGYPDFNPAELK